MFRPVVFLSFVALLMVQIVSANTLPDFTSIVETQSDAVVKITTITRSTGQARPDPFEGYGRSPDELPEIFRHFFENGGQPQPREREAIGSGFLISSDGYVLTNHHVVDGVDEIVVRLIDRREFAAEVVGSDPRSDLALLKVDGADLPAVTMAKADQLKVGEWVLAIGSPFGLDYSVAAGIVSAIGRSIPNGEQGNYVPFIQTDVAINPGNSGGPLFNLAGEVIGINSQIYSPSGGSIGLSFAIPIGLALDVVEQLKASGSVARGWLGVGIQDVSKDLAESFELEKPEGALISYVEEDGPGDQGGVRVGDVILLFDNNPIATSDELPHFVGLTRPGSIVDVVVVRDGQRKTLRVKVGTLDGEEGLDAKSMPAGQATNLGMVLEDLDEEFARSWNISSGVIVVEVEPDSPAALAYLRPGDVITMVGNVPIASLDDFKTVAKSLPAGRRVPLRVIRRGQAGFVAIQIPTK